MSDKYHEVLIGSQKNSLLAFNVHRAVIQRQVEMEQGVCGIKRSRYLFCAGMDGQLMLLDPRSYKVEHRIAAHSGGFIDFDISGDTIVTCGFSDRNGYYVGDPLIKVYDMRTLKPLTPVSFHGTPQRLKFHPKLSSVVLAVSQSGRVQLSDVNSSKSFGFLHADFPKAQCMAFEISNTGEMLAFGDSIGIVHLWAEQMQPKVNFFSQATFLPDPVVQLSGIAIDDPLSLSSIQTPYMQDEELLSDWPPENVALEPGKRPSRIDPEILMNMKQTDFVGYAPNPMSRRRNERRRASKLTEVVPKFRSEKERELNKPKPETVVCVLASCIVKCEQLTDAYRMKRAHIMLSTIRSGRLKLNIASSVSRILISGLIFYPRIPSSSLTLASSIRFYNQTPFGGLETHIHNSYCNSFLQALYFVWPMRAMFISHCSSFCLNASCLACELGFLFRMLDDSNGQNCQATNFLRVFSSSTQAQLLGLFEPEQPKPTTVYADLIQGFSRFIFDQLHLDCKGLPSPTCFDTTGTFIEQLFGMRFEYINACCVCHQRLVKENVLFCVDFIYPKSPNKTPHFEDVVQASLAKEGPIKSWCDRCDKYQNSNFRRILKNAPNVITINCASNEPESL